MMVHLPRNFTATKYPGYFWNMIEERLYSIKIDGILKPLKISNPNYFNKIQEPCYRVSVRGKRRCLMLSYLKKLVCQDTEIPVKGKKHDSNS